MRRKDLCDCFSFKTANISMIVYSVYLLVCFGLCVSFLHPGTRRVVYVLFEVNLQCRRDRWMKFIKHVTVNTPSRAKTLQRINKCWLYQPLPPVIYTPE